MSLKFLCYLLLAPKSAQVEWKVPKNYCWGYWLNAEDTVKEIGFITRLSFHLLENRLPWSRVKYLTSLPSLISDWLKSKKALTKDSWNDGCEWFLLLLSSTTVGITVEEIVFWSSTLFIAISHTSRIQKKKKKKWASFIIKLKQRPHYVHGFTF